MLKNELDVTLLRAETLKEKPDQSQLGFGKHFTDHMLTMRWDKEQGWHDAEIRPYANFSLDPAAMVLHYSQEIFEGLKAYRGVDDAVLLFRPMDNLNRFNDSADRMCMPRIPAEKVLQALKGLIYLEREWIPKVEGGALYIRPAMIASEAALGVRPANEYLFFVICSPVGAYYAEGFNPTKIYVEDEYVRAVPGGVGNVKTGGNYAASIKAHTTSQRKGYTQVLWLDAVERKYIEEVGTSNIFFVINGELVTPPLGGTILPGITRDTVLQLAKDWEIPTSERRITIDEVIAAVEDGSLTEAFGSGTAAVISPIGEFGYQGNSIAVNHGETGPLAQRFFDGIQDLQRGATPDMHEWIVRVK
ncbi:MAG: branched-chain amino acid aminotransferase [Candidatus Electrothrix aestuarii]|uniref:Branched-chain-amino-acid aminotransferase n=1 Tax=Candidatus Electrothrix aestuarii TaxID=3062594 RepID=A0AAU8LZL0_9BACT|nr:branched-chain amino acid aminotransferase [Candidatus Electrothrix aestuarii]